MGYILGGFYGSLAVAAAVRACATQRVDFVGIGDSNQLKDGTGHDHGWQYALSQSYQMYATGLITANEGGGQSAAQGYTYNRISNNLAFGQTSGADSFLDDYLNKGAGALNPNGYWFVPSGSSISTSTNNGLQIDATSPLDIKANLIWRFHYGKFPTGTGQWKPAIRNESSPFAFPSQTGSATISTNGGSYGMASVDVQAAADATRNVPMSGKWVFPGGVAIAGPAFGTYVHCINPNRNVGFAYSTLEARSGQPLRTMAYDLQQCSNTTLTHYFSIIRTRQLEKNSNVKIIVTINSGVNDRNAAASASVGPNPVAQGDSQAAFLDNLQAIYNRLAAIWNLNGWSLSELHFIVTVSHPVSDPEDTKLANYRAAAQQFCDNNPRCATINPRTLGFTRANFLSQSWYLMLDATNPDTSHLTQAGYEGYELAQVGAITPVPSVSPPSSVSANPQPTSVVVSSVVPVGAAAIAFYRDETLISTVSGAEGATVTYIDTNRLLNVNYTYTARGADDGGNVSSTATVPVTVTPSYFSSQNIADVVTALRSNLTPELSTVTKLGLDTKTIVKNETGIIYKDGDTTVGTRSIATAGDTVTIGEVTT